MSPLARRVAARHLTAGVSLQDVINAAQAKFHAKLVSDFPRKWAPEIESRFAQDFPLWDVLVEIKYVEGDAWPGQEPDSFDISLEVHPSGQHPDKDWVFLLDIEIAKQFDRWFRERFGLSTRFEDASQDMDRHNQGFPAHGHAHRLVL